MTRRLALTRETLAELTTDDLAAVAAGEAITNREQCGHTFPVKDCFSLYRTCWTTG